MVRKHRKNIGQDNSINSNYNNSGSNKRKGGSYFELSRRKRRRYIVIIVPVVALAIAVTAISASLYSSDINNYGTVGSAHEHAAFMIQLDNKTIDFGQDKYQVKSRLIHVEGGDGFTIHRHTDRVPFGEFLKSVNMQIKDGCFIAGSDVDEQQPQQYCSNDQKDLRVFINGKELEDPDAIMDYVLKSNDRILILYGSETADEINQDFDVLRQVELPTESEPLQTGTVAPDFSLVDAERGNTITKQTFKGKPLFIFFTTTWCTPCQIGAENLARYDDETGGSAFNTLIVFVDDTETDKQFIDWKKKYGRDDWYIAEGTDMAQTYNVQYLDTKYVFDGNGIIKWIDIKPLEYSNIKPVLEPLLSTQ